MWRYKLIRQEKFSSTNKSNWWFIPTMKQPFWPTGHFYNTVRLLTHVLSKPTHFFFHSFIATMSYALQTSFNRVMKDWADKYHVWGTPRGHLLGQNDDNSNTRFFHTKKEHINMCSYIISVVYICHSISCLKVFALLYHIPHTYGMHM